MPREPGFIPLPTCMYFVTLYTLWYHTGFSGTAAMYEGNVVAYLLLILLCSYGADNINNASLLTIKTANQSVRRGEQGRIIRFLWRWNILHTVVSPVS